MKGPTFSGDVGGRDDKRVISSNLAQTPPASVLGAHGVFTVLPSGCRAVLFYLPVMALGFL